MPRLHAHDRRPSPQSLLRIRVTSSSHELSCRLWTRRRGLMRAAVDETPCFHNLVSELKACGRVGTRKGGREEPGEKHLVDKATEDLLHRTNSGRVEDAQARDKFSRSVRQTKTEQTRAAQWKQTRKSPLEEVAERVGWQAGEKRERWRRRAVNAL